MPVQNERPMPDAKIENLVGALSLALADSILKVAQHHVPLSAPAAAIAMISHVPGITIDQLSRVLGLSHPGTVRLVDRLEHSQIAIRSKSANDGRAVALTLTESGEQISQRIFASRQNTLSRALASLSSEDRQTLARLAEAMLRGIVKGEDHALEICRLCDTTTCNECPIENEFLSRQIQDF